MRQIHASLFAGSGIVRPTSSMKETASMIRSDNFSRRGFGLRSLVAAVAVVFATSGLAQEADITFNLFSVGNGLASFSVTSGAYTLNLFNPVSSGNTTGLFKTDSDGIWLGLGNAPYNAGFDMSLTGGLLQFKQYVIGYINNFGGVPTIGNFSLLGGSGTSSGNPLNPAGTFTFAGSTIISPGDTVKLSGNITSDPNPGLTQIKSITFSTLPVPEPSTYALGAIASGLIAWIARRRKARKG